MTTFPPSTPYQECIHCGLCLTACPTYLVTGLEAESPRGRLLLMASYHIHPDETARYHVDNCLDCRACVTACPSGVDYATTLDQFRGKQEQKNPSLSPLRRILLKAVLNRKWMGVFQYFTWLAEKTGLLKMAAPIVPAVKGLPELRSKSFTGNSKTVFPAVGEKRGAVAFFTGCVMENLYPHVHDATIRILQWNGFEVHVPPSQTCCGALHHHSGGREFLPELIRRNEQAFAEFSTIIVNAAGCGAELKDYPDKIFARKIKDITEFLTDVDLKPPGGKVSTRPVVWDAPCHLIHGQGIATEPEQLLKRFGFELVPNPQSHICCGAAGSYSLTHPQMSADILQMKMEDVARTGCSTIVTANPGCQMQLTSGLRSRGMDGAVLHICELLDSAYRSDPEYSRQFQLSEENI